MELGDEPKDVMVLNALSKGKNDEKSIAKMTGLSMFDVIGTIERLITRGLAIREEKKGFFGKKIKIRLTEKGFKELQERRYELEQKWQRMVNLANNGNTQELQRYAENNRSWILPMMMFGIIDMMMFMSMLSLMGLAMNHFVPEGMESSVPSEGMEGMGGDQGSDVGDFGDLGDISF